MNVESWMMKRGLEISSGHDVILSSWFVENILPLSFSFLLFSQWITNDCAVTMKIVWLSVQLVEKRTQSAQESPLPLSTSSNLKSTKPTASATITYHAAFAVNVENGSLHLRRVRSSQKAFVSAGTQSIFPDSVLPHDLRHVYVWLARELVLRRKISRFQNKPTFHGNRLMSPRRQRQVNIYTVWYDWGLSNKPTKYTAIIIAHNFFSQPVVATSEVSSRLRFVQSVMGR